MRTNGSRPFRLSLCQGLGRDSRSDTEPCVRPRILSPNSRCPGDRGQGQPVTQAGQRSLLHSRSRPDVRAQAISTNAEGARDCGTHTGGRGDTEGN
jgi:hypothetical protein